MSFLKKFYIRDLKGLLLERKFKLIETGGIDKRVLFVKKLSFNDNVVQTYDITGLSAEILPTGRVIFRLLFIRPNDDYIIRQILNGEQIEPIKALAEDNFIVFCGNITDHHFMRGVLTSCFNDIDKGTYRTFPDWLRLNYDMIPKVVEEELGAMINVTLSEYVRRILDVIIRTKFPDYEVDSNDDLINDVKGSTYSEDTQDSGSKIIQFPTIHMDDDT